eukprot:49732-Rhodomonas_salina.1
MAAMPLLMWQHGAVYHASSAISDGNSDVCGSARAAIYGGKCCYLWRQLLLFITAVAAIYCGNAAIYGGYLQRRFSDI